mmetsp:Transcript_17250/g.41308  ORF Transcript_17250/g.41308 Transcript_17250/m.41308 type:complete len:329 (+) Transcript_17250:2738-3724(+)
MRGRAALGAVHVLVHPPRAHVSHRVLVHAHGGESILHAVVGIVGASGIRNGRSDPAMHVTHMVLPAGSNEERDVAGGHREPALLEVVRHRAVQVNAEVGATLDGLLEAVHEGVRHRDRAEASRPIARNAERVAGGFLSNVELDHAVFRHSGNLGSGDEKRICVVHKRLRHFPLVVGLGALVGDEDGAGGIAVGGLVEGARGVGGTERAGLDHEVCLHVRAQRVLRLLAEQIADLVHLSVEDADVLVEPEDVRANRHTHSSIASRCSVLSRRHRVAHQQAQRLRAVYSRVERRAHIRGSLARVAHTSREAELDRAEDHLAVEVASLAFS